MIHTADVSAHKESANDVAYDLCISLAFEKQNVSIMSACFLMTNQASTVPLQWQSLTSSFHTLPIINKKRVTVVLGIPKSCRFLSSFSIFSTGALGAKSVLSGAAPGLGGFDDIC